MIKDHIKNRILCFNYSVDKNSYNLDISSNFNNQHCEVIQELSDDVLSIQIIPKCEIKIDSLMIKFNFDFNQDDLIYVNGYQSWTDSKEFFADEKMKTLSKFSKPLLPHYQFDKYGDYNFKSYSNHKGDFHGYTYGYIRSGNDYQLIGSLSEKQGYTILNTRVTKNEIVIEKECKGLVINSKYHAFNLFFTSGDEKFVFDSYFEKMMIDKPKSKPMTGWTSWYNYYQNINESIILKNIHSLKNANKNINIFQIDDGYQTFVGDWLDIDLNKFPNGMKYISDKIHQEGYKSGLWLAPFVCETNSKLFKEHQDWILKDKEGKLVLAGSNWSRFYALNLELEEVKNYIRYCFDEVLNDWSFDLVKLDFLYAACIIPTQTKTRGQLMCEAMEFLRDCVKDKLILGCGVPLGPSFGLVDYCRIGCDVGLDWNDKFYMQYLHRERVSTLNAIQNSISRRHLNNRAFLNDPDVFFLRDENIQLNRTQKETLAFVNKHFGSLIFTSDDISLYKNQDKLFDSTMKNESIEIVEVNPNRNGVIEVKYRNQWGKFVAHINLSSKTILDLKAFETKVVEIKEL